MFVTAQCFEDAVSVTLRRRQEDRYPGPLPEFRERPIDLPYGVTDD